MDHKRRDNPDDMLAIYGADRRRWPGRAAGIAKPGTLPAEVEALGIDRILDHASRPTAPKDSVARLLDRLNGPPDARVIEFRPGKSSKTQFLQYAALPLAASLALGIYLGALGALDVVLPSAITGSVASSDDPQDDLGGVGELDAYAEDNVI